MVFVSLFAVCAVIGTAHADENADLNMIPGSVDQPAPAAAGPAPSTATSGKIYVEDAFTVNSRRGDLAVPLPPSSTPATEWQNRTSLDATHKWSIGDGLDVAFSDRFNLVEQNNIDIPAHQQFRNDFREGYVTWEAAPQSYLEVGRINVRHGTAIGYNPTDFFKTRSQVDQASQDPSVIREDRSGAKNIRGRLGEFRGRAAPRTAQRDPYRMAAQHRSGFRPHQWREPDAALGQLRDRRWVEPGGPALSRRQ
jgi:hypothetical protein